MMHTRIYVRILGFCLLFPVFGLQAIPVYTITDIGSFPNSFRSEAFAVNDYGEVVGYSRNEEFTNRAFYWQNGVMTDVTPVGSSFGLAYDINNYSSIVGITSKEIGTGSVGFSGQPGNTTRLSDTVEVFQNGINRATATNNLGSVSGSYTSPGQRDQSGFVFGQNGLTTYGTRNIDLVTINDINDKNYVTGTISTPNGNNLSGFIGDDLGNIVRLDSPTGKISRLNAINNHNVITGSQRIEDNRGRNNIAFRAIVGGVNGFTDIGVLGDHVNSRATGINDLGYVVGSASTDFVGTDLFLWHEDEGLFNLTDAITDLSGWDSLYVANDISNTGYIVGTGLRSNGERHGFLLTPNTVSVLEPESLVLMLLGLGLLGYFVSRKGLFIV